MSFSVQRLILLFCVYLPFSPQCTCWTIRSKLSYHLCCVFITVIRVLFPSFHTCSNTLWSLGGSSVQLKQGFQPFQSCSELCCFPPKLRRKLAVTFHHVCPEVLFLTNWHSTKWGEHSVSVCVYRECEWRSGVSWASMSQVTVCLLVS